jgi:hypothetical protein
MYVYPGDTTFPFGLFFLVQSGWDTMFHDDISEYEKGGYWRERERETQNKRKEGGKKSRKVAAPRFDRGTSGYHQIWALRAIPAAPCCLPN